MNFTRIIGTATLLLSVSLTTMAYQAPPLVLLEDEDGVVEQPAQPQSDTQPAPQQDADSPTPTTAKPRPSTIGGLVLIDEEEDALPAEEEPATTIESKHKEEFYPTTTPAPATDWGTTVFQRYYKHSGQTMVSILSMGYSTYFQVGSTMDGAPADYTFLRNMLNFEILEWRVKWFGMQILNFEMGINQETTIRGTPTRYIYTFERGGENSDERVEATSKTKWFAYKPAVKFYVPCTKWLALELYGGIEVDITKMWSKIATVLITQNLRITANRKVSRFPNRTSSLPYTAEQALCLRAYRTSPWR